MEATKEHTQVPLTIYLPHGLDEVLWVLEANEAVAFALVASLVPNHFGLEERRELAKDPNQDFVRYVIAKVPAE